MDEFDDLIKTLKSIFSQEPTLIPFTKIQGRLYKVVRTDRYNVISYRDRPTFVMVDARKLERVRKILKSMGYITKESFLDDLGIPEIPNKDKLELSVSEDELKSVPPLTTFFGSVQEGE